MRQQGRWLLPERLVRREEERLPGCTVSGDLVSVSLGHPAGPSLDAGRCHDRAALLQVRQILLVPPSQLGNKAAVPVPLQAHPEQGAHQESAKPEWGLLACISLLLGELAQLFRDALISR